MSKYPFVSYSYEPSSILLFGLVLGAIAATVLMTAVLPSHKRAELSPAMQKVHDFFNFKTFWMSGILKVLYIVSTTVALCAGLYLLTLEPLQGLLFLILAPVLLRLLYEAAYLFLSIRSEVREINRKLDQTGPSPDADGEPPSAAHNICKNCGNELNPSNLFCPECGTRRS
jgi:uncharacterized membrane protein